ncbi:MAG: hypothetical protein NXI19_14595 [Alphaproteobacteria bacterium]|nr:hypothetical protein [Alphaproteobacteria bacterium]
MKKDTSPTEPSDSAKSVDWRSVGLYLVPYLVMIGLAVVLLPQTIAAHMASGIWVTICSAFGIK